MDWNDRSEASFVWIFNVPAREELELAARTAAGDANAFRLLVDRHQAAVFRYALALVGRREDAEDVLQDVFLALLRHAAGFRGDASMRTWLLTVTRNSAFRVRGRTARLAEDSVELDELGKAAGWGAADPEQLAIRAQDRTRLQGALEGLGAEDREVIALRELEGMSGAETAEVLGVSLTAMKSRIHRARLRLAAALRQGGEQ